VAQKWALEVASDSLILPQILERRAIRTNLRINAGSLFGRERLLDELQDSENLRRTNIDREMAAPRAARATGERANVRRGGDPGVMALLRIHERGEHSQVADLIACAQSLPFQYAANKGDIEGKFHGSILTPIPHGGTARYTAAHGAT
jgi:hypothetical protein